MAWAALLGERSGIPPNERHAEITAILETLNARFLALQEAAIAASRAGVA